MRQVHTASWGAGVRAGMVFGLVTGFGLGCSIVGLVWWFVA